MSLLIKSSRGDRDTIYRMRGLSTIFGESKKGILSLDTVDKNYFALFAFGDRYLIRIDDPSLKFNGKMFNIGEQRWITDGDKIECRDYHFEFITTSETAELLSSTANAADILSQISCSNESYPTISYGAGTLNRVFPLFFGIDITVGSSPKDHIYIPFDEVSPGHCLLSAESGEVLVKPLSGSVTINGNNVIRKQKIKNSSELRLEPSQIPIVITFPN